MVKQDFRRPKTAHGSITSPPIVIDGRRNLSSNKTIGAREALTLESATIVTKLAIFRGSAPRSPNRKETEENEALTRVPASTAINRAI